MAPAAHLYLRSMLPTMPSAHSMQRASGLFARGDEPKPNNDKPHGVLDPHDINNAGFFALFALIGVAFVVTGIWFFFWARNGGFYFRDNDWDDYKSTVLRRKGPNGTVLSGATKSTNLGGGSVYKDVGEDDGTTVVTESTALSGITAGASDIAAREKRKHKLERRERERERERRKRRGDKKQRSGRHVGEDGGVLDETAEKEAQKELRSYRHEKPARVGGLNKQSEGSHWDGSTNTAESTAASSDLLSNRQSTPTRSTQQPAIRKVYSTTSTDRETERIRGEARRLREEGRTARRDFSYQRPGGAESALSESLLEGSGGGSELGTKSYHHPMPELREREGGGGSGGESGGRDQERERERERRREREERRARRGGYRRGVGDEDL